MSERVAKGLLYLFGCILLIMFLCRVGVFDIHVKLTLIILGVVVVTLIVPSVLILKVRIYHPVMKYYIVAALSVYHIITGFYVFMPWIEPFVGVGEIVRYGALPRCIQYAGCFLLILFLVDRNSEEEKTMHAVCEIQDEDKSAFEELMGRLTEREQSVFELLVSGYINMQICERI